VKPSRTLKVATVVISIFCALGLLEFIIWATFWATGRDITRYQPTSAYNVTLADARRFVSHPFLPFAPRPGDARTIKVFSPDTGRAYTTIYTLNSLGFRTPERPFAKAPGVKRIVCLGGSTTFGGATDAETWPALLEARLNAVYASRVRVEVINLAMDNAASPTSLVDLAFIGVEYAPDLVVSYDGVNDTQLIGREGVAPDYRNALRRFDDSYRSLQARLPGWAFHSYLVTLTAYKLDALTGGASDLGSQVFTAYKLPPATDPRAGVNYYERNLKLMRAISREYNARFLAATAHWVEPDAKVRALNDELRSFFAREKISYLDLDGDLPHCDWTLHVDQVHWTRAGLERVADAWAEKITRERLLE
jgi:lysophospholipase L1-like esterase